MISLYESLLDDFDNLSDAIDPREEIERFLNDIYYCNLAWATDKLFTISKKPNKDGLYLVDALSGSWIEVKDSKKESLEHITNGMFVFNKVVGGLSLRNCINLKSLKGAPLEATHFNCNGCSSLKSLKGGPTKVDHFTCIDCDNLTNLKGSPRYVLKSFCCDNCKNLKSLEGAPIVIGTHFSCEDCTNLKTLKGAPKEVNGDFNCSSCGKKFSKIDVEKICKVGGHIITWM